MPRLLLIAGNGRNVGKTYLACRLIHRLSQNAPVTAVKITPHFHPILRDDLILETDDFIILEEKQITQKDSSLMLQAGAERVFFVMVKSDSHLNAFTELEKLLPQQAIVCESGGLHEVVDPGLFLFVNFAGREIQKPNHLAYRHLLLTNDGNKFTPELENLRFDGQRFIY